MPSVPDLASVAALIGDATRARMLAALMDGRSLTPSELALEGGVTASTASTHLARLAAAGLVVITQHGRHRYVRIGSPDVASVLEGLMGLAARHGAATVRTGPRDAGLRHARVCYDHLAGEAGVRLFERLQDAEFISGSDDTPALTARGEAWCEEVGIDLTTLHATRRRLCRSCLDWSERRTHLAGALGAALLDRLFALRCARREAGSRAVILSPRGESFVEHLAVVPGGGSRRGARPAGA
ncbi:MAG TPA: winged helix-turn-helix domain-containing protein [Gemmatimonadaceae bacterium]|nr:winged helix-turn-helix domain-containing protein [Gemmatimonadaceae bacterium]